ncbi:MAG: hypothetical protein AB7I50_18060 [Vicinamibacterales bacterium]
MPLPLVETEIALAQGWDVDLGDPRDPADVVDVEQTRVMRRATTRQAVRRKLAAVSHSVQAGGVRQVALTK